MGTVLHMKINQYYYMFTLCNYTRLVLTIAAKVNYTPGIFKNFLLGGSNGKASAYNAGDSGSIPGLGRSSG